MGRKRGQAAGFQPKGAVPAGADGVKNRQKRRF